MDLTRMCLRLGCGGAVVRWYAGETAVLNRSWIGFYVTVAKKRRWWDVFVPTWWTVTSKWISIARIEVLTPHGTPRRSTAGVGLAVRAGIGLGEMPQDE
jgi:hypothetical protein